jgi:hypothetical protein
MPLWLRPPWANLEQTLWFLVQFALAITFVIHAARIALGAAEADLWFAGSGCALGATVGVRRARTRR